MCKTWNSISTFDRTRMDSTAHMSHMHVCMHSIQWTQIFIDQSGIYLFWTEDLIMESTNGFFHRSNHECARSLSIFACFAYLFIKQCAPQVFTFERYVLKSALGLIHIALVWWDGIKKKLKHQFKTWEQSMVSSDLQTI